MSNRNNHGQDNAAAGTEVAGDRYRDFDDRLRRVEELVHGGKDDELIKKSLVRDRDSFKLILKWGTRVALAILVPVLGLVAKALAGLVATAMAK